MISCIINTHTRQCPGIQLLYIIQFIIIMHAGKNCLNSLNRQDDCQYVHDKLLQSNQWNYEQYFMDIFLHLCCLIHQSLPNPWYCIVVLQYFMEGAPFFPVHQIQWKKGSLKCHKIYVI